MKRGTEYSVAQWKFLKNALFCTMTMHQHTPIYLSNSFWQNIIKLWFCALFSRYGPLWLFHFSYSQMMFFYKRKSWWRQNHRPSSRQYLRDILPVLFKLEITLAQVYDITGITLKRTGYEDWINSYHGN